MSFFTDSIPAESVERFLQCEAAFPKHASRHVVEEERGKFIYLVVLRAIQEGEACGQGAGAAASDMGLVIYGLSLSVLTPIDGEGKFSLWHFHLCALFLFCLCFAFCVLTH